MSRIGKKPIAVPAGVEVKIDGHTVTVKGPKGTLSRKLNPAIDVAHACGVECPKVAPLAAVEVVNPKMPCTVDADELRKMNAEGKITGCVVDGPLSMDIAIDPEAAHHKGAQDRPAAGHADILLFPDIQAGNLDRKSVV